MTTPDDFIDTEKEEEERQIKLTNLLSRLDCIFDAMNLPATMEYLWIRKSLRELLQK